MSAVCLGAESDGVIGSEAGVALPESRPAGLVVGVHVRVRAVVLCTGWSRGKRNVSVSILFLLG